MSMISQPTRIIKPTPQRRQHGPIERSERIQDVAGDASLPWQSLSLLAGWERARAITPEMRIAGERFHAIFHMACLDPIKAADMSRPGGCAGSPQHHGSVNAQDQIAVTMKLLGGHGSVEGCGAWIVLGCDYSIAKWMARETHRGRPMHNRVAKRVLIDVLGRLVKHYGY